MKTSKVPEQMMNESNLIGSQKVINMLVVGICFTCE